jgi:hypothetical protein
LLGSLAIIRMVFYVLRLSLVGATWLLQFERIFAGLVWAIVALHITGLLPDVIAMLESVSFSTGKQKLTLWHLLQGIAAVLVTVLLALWAFQRCRGAAQCGDRARQEPAGGFRPAVQGAADPARGADRPAHGRHRPHHAFGVRRRARRRPRPRPAADRQQLCVRLHHPARQLDPHRQRDLGRQRPRRSDAHHHALHRAEEQHRRRGLVPNELLVSSVVQNESYSDPRVRIALPVQVGYDSDLERAMAIMAAAAAAQPRVLADPAPAVLLARIRRFRHQPRTRLLGRRSGARHGPILRSDINLAIWREFKQAGIFDPVPATRSTHSQRGRP